MNALTGVAWADDNQVARYVDPEKRWGPESGLRVTFRALT